MEVTFGKIVFDSLGNILIHAQKLCVENVDLTGLDDLGNAHCRQDLRVLKLAFQNFEKET